MAQPVVEKDGDQLFPSMRRDGTLLFVESHPEMGRDIWLQTPDGKQHEWLATSKNEYWPTFSPNGELIAYASDQSERFEVYVSPVSDPNTRHQISTEGGVYPGLVSEWGLCVLQAGNEIPGGRCASRRKRGREAPPAVRRWLAPWN